MKKLLFAITSLATLAAVTACGPAEQQINAGQLATSLTPTPETASYAEFNTTATIRDVMNTLIDPSADALWNAVRFEMDAQGSRELRPETDEQWQELHEHAVAIIEGGNSLMIPGRRVAPVGATTEFPEFEYVPEEVEQKLQQDRQSWLGFAQALQASAIVMLQAVQARDADLLTEYGAQLDEACESCHSQYWYRAESQ